ncbi:Os03g0218800 [Oryza sativa Japonica Group]|uniref:Os03g0218800 protein n=1 Tax=Oryza sativa subsp. japonica TaxID=39947 RepID=A0A0P0VUV6_ORYSJ|nr:Os03g0218800 [Oryza sativa Japonica Group]
MEDLAATWRTTTAKRPLAVAGVSGSGDSGRFAAAVTVEALAMSADAGRWWQQVEVRGEDGDGEVARRSTAAAVVVVAVIAVTGGMMASDG